MPTVHLYLSEEEYDKVLEIARELNVKVPKVIRFMIQRYINEEKKGD